MTFVIGLLETVLTAVKKDNVMSAKKGFTFLTLKLSVSLRIILHIVRMRLVSGAHLIMETGDVLNASTGIISR